MKIRKTDILLLMLGLILALTGCGDNDAVHTNAGVQNVEAGQENESVSDDGENGKEAGETTEDGQSEESGEIENAEEIEEISTVQEEMNVEEPLKSQLTAELLEENGLDTSVVANTRATKGCTFTLPEGFEASEDAEGVYVTSRYPIDASTIYYAQLDQDMALQLMTQEMFMEQAQEEFREIYGEDVEIAIDSFEQMKIQGYPAFKIQCHYQVEDVKVTQLAYVINADKSYVITYSQTGDYDWMEAYEASAETIRVEY